MAANNISKIQQLRFWMRWKATGALGVIEDAEIKALSKIAHFTWDMIPTHDRIRLERHIVGKKMAKQERKYQKSLRNIPQSEYGDFEEIQTC
jgi:hypothetical protein